MTNFSGNRFIPLALAFVVSLCALEARAKGAESHADPLGGYGCGRSGYQVSQGFGRESSIAVMPVENLSGEASPLREIRTLMTDALKMRGVSVLEESVLEEFMARHRMRYTGGMTKELGKSLRDETGAKGVLFTSLDLYNEADPPGIALTSRLVCTGEGAGILWMENVALTGYDSPGILDLGRIRDPRVLRELAVKGLAESLARMSRGGETHKIRETPLGEDPRFQPKEFYRSPRVPIGMGGPLVVAVLPFQNGSGTRNAGEVMMLQFLRHLSGLENIEVVEPGIVRQALLTTRTIMEGGISLPQADLLSDVLDIDLVLTGIVSEYRDSGGFSGAPPGVNFSIRAIHSKTREMVWSAVCYNRGDDGVFFFDMGKINSSHALASTMTQAVVERFHRERSEIPPGIRKETE